MAFALLYNRQDFAQFVADVNASVDRVSVSDRGLWNAVWTGGLRDWERSKPATGAYAEGGTENPTLAVVVDSPNPQVGGRVTKEQFAQLLERIAATNPAAGFLVSVADDLRRSAVEPWPPPPGSPQP